MNTECDHNKTVQVTNIYGLIDLRCGNCDKRLAWEQINKETDTIEVRAISADYEQLLRDARQDDK